MLLLLEISLHNYNDDITHHKRSSAALLEIDTFSTCAVKQ